MDFHQRSMCQMGELYRRVIRRRYGGRQTHQVSVYELDCVGSSLNHATLRWGEVPVIIRGAEF